MIRHGLPSGSNPVYQFYGKEGKECSYNHMLNQLSAADVVLFGELHDNAVVHLLQFEMTRDLFEARNGNLTLGAEMFEADNQLILDEYLAELITETKFEEEARLWKNYTTDYKPLVLFAKENKLAFIATNIPRRYANSVFKQGVDVLDRRTMGNTGEHLRMKLRQDDSVWDCVAFRLSNHQDELSSRLDIVYNVEVDNWGGKNRLRLNILDFKSSA